MFGVSQSGSRWKSTGAVKVNLAAPVGIVRFLKGHDLHSERAKVGERGVDRETLFGSLDTGAAGVIDG